MKLGKIILAIALVVVGLGMYAGSTWSAQQMNLGHWVRPADENGVIVVCPSATRLSSLGHTFRIGDGFAPDVRFISDLIDTRTIVATTISFFAPRREVIESARSSRRR